MAGDFQVRIGLTYANAKNGTGTEGTDHVTFPISSTYKTTSTTIVNSSRNSKAEVVATVIASGIRKIELSWRVMTLANYSALAKFFNTNFMFYVYYFDMDDNKWEVRQCYVGDRIADSVKNEQWTMNTNVGGNIAPKHIENFKLSLIDVGKGEITS